MVMTFNQLTAKAMQAARAKEKCACGKEEVSSSLLGKSSLWYAYVTSISSLVMSLPQQTHKYTP